jgi:putative FmdB family regulatory protein
MPVYDYLCDDCGAFTALRPMAESGASLECPGCGCEAPRAYLTAPHLATMSSERRLAHAANERSAHAPQNLAALKAKHGAGCGCCGGKSLMRRTQRGKKGAKSFPGGRPWMISH